MNPERVLQNLMVILLLLCNPFRVVPRVNTIPRVALHLPWAIECNPFGVSPSGNSEQKNVLAYAGSRYFGIGALAPVSGFPGYFVPVPN